MENAKFKKLFKHPVETASFLSKICFCWILPLFAKGIKKDLTEDDLYAPLVEHESSKLGDKLEKAWKSEQCKKNPSLWKALAKVFGKTLALYGLFCLIIEFIFRMGQPLLIARLLSYYTPNQTTVSKKDAYIYASLIVVFQFCNVITIHTCMLGLAHLGMKIRVATCSLVYRKALRLSKSSLGETTIGQMVNLLSNDVNRFDISVIHINHIWIAPLETVILMYLMYDNVGPTAMTGVAFMFMIIPIQMYMGKRTSNLRLKTALKTDERVRLMNEIISGIQVIKMYTWEKPFAKLVELTRINEIKQISNTSILRAITVSFPIFFNRTAIYVCILSYILMGNHPSHQYVFVVTSFYSVLKQSATVFFPHGITCLAEAAVSVKRIQKFLMLEEIGKELVENDYNSQINGPSSITLQKYSSCIDLQNATVKWIASSVDNTLNNICFKVNEGQLVAVVGLVGSGKSTLLHTILKELPLVKGRIYVEGTVSYVSQEPWIFSASVRQNILFGQEFDAKKYQEVIRVCALETDLSMFQYGDRTLVGERGVMLSGGQKARINLARAIYKEADIYLLDDPLSAVDTHVGKQLFDHCISGYLKDKTTVLVTHQLQYLRNVDRIYFMEEGTISTSGTYEHLLNMGNDFLNLIKEHTTQDRDVEGDFSEKIRMNDNGVEKDDLKKPELNIEQKDIGKISIHVYSKYLRSGGCWLRSFGIFFIFFLVQLLASGTDYFLTFWVNLEQERQEDVLNASIQLKNFFNTTSLDRPINHINILNNEPSFMGLYFSENNCLYIYSGLILSLLLLTLFRSISFFKFCMTASRNLHNTMFNKIIYAKMSFFNTNPSGRILNRFSKDMGSIDEFLPITFVDAVQICLTALAISVVVASMNPWILIPTAIIACIFYMIRVVYLATSRDIKRLEGTTRSPVFSHLSASLRGLTTIRAFNAQRILQTEFDNHQNLHSSAFYIFLSATRSFGFWLDMHCVIYTALVTVSFLFIENEIHGGNVGLAITQTLNLSGMFQWGMRQWSELENQMTSVERVVKYIEIDRENSEKFKEPPKHWPEKGKIKFDSVSMRYFPEEPLVLKNLNFTINTTEKIGIVGRTGAGKSSLIYALFRLTDFNGCITIDQLNTKEISLKSLRSKISIIPQEPVLFSGSLRKNLDPFDEYNDGILWNALEEVELKNVVNDFSSGLDSKMSEGGTNFSVGQRQLLCLARAIIRRNKILVLDEATANVDPQTDALIQSTIRRKFAECTVLTIAHRLHTIMDSDRVLVMNSGSVVEFDKPHVLLQNPDGVFSGLVKQTGKGMAENLVSIAEENYKKTN